MNKIKELYRKWFPKRDIAARIGFLDEVRGLLVILMVLYHLFYSLSYSDLLFGTMFQFNLINIIESPVMNILRDIGAGLFIFICGVSCALSKNNYRRGLLVFFAGILVTVVTVFYNYGDQQILWGILHCLGVSLILYSLLEKPLSKTKWYIMVPIFAVLAILTFGLASGDSYARFIGVPFVKSLQINTYNLAYNSSVYSNIAKFLFPLGFTAPNFMTADWFPLLPWIFVLFTGSFYGRRLKEGRALKFVYKTHVRPLAFVGRHALIIYLLHQPIIIGVIKLLELIF